MIQNKGLSRRKKIALVGNPNCGKTTLFNQITGLNHKVGNFPGVTVEKKTGIVKSEDAELEFIDLPGCYSLSSTSPDEKVVQDILLNTQDAAFPDTIVLVLDVTNLKRNLFLATQVIDLNIPTIIALNMSDVAEKKNLLVNLDLFKEKLGVPVVTISAKKKSGISTLMDLLKTDLQAPAGKIVDTAPFGKDTLREVCEKTSLTNTYQAFKIINNIEAIEWQEEKPIIASILNNHNYNRNEAELFEINARYQFINEVVKETVEDHHKQSEEDRLTEKLDKVITHPFWGFLIFLSVFFLLFQSVFTLSQFPMEWINDGMGWLAESVSNWLPKGMFSKFITEGVLGGIGGILVFLPQIMILFGLITVLEDSGYLSRISFMSDRLLRTFGMNGKSVIPLVGGFACAVPAIMAARNIESRKERLITIFITPLMSCSARLPVYVFLTSFIVPNELVGGVISLQGLFMMGLYLLGIIFSLIIAFVINKFIIVKEKSSFILELPKYGIPTLKNVVYSMINKGKTFVVQAGKIILIASVILWFLSSYGPPSQMERINTKYEQSSYSENYTPEEIDQLKGAEKLEYSYIGYFGKTIEPTIKPLGFDWKVGIALISSFAAREVFVGTMTTIYSVQSGGNSKDALASIKFSKPTAFSLLIFYVFALQCMSTIAIVKQETGKWKFAIIQFLVFTGIAYLSSLLIYQIMT